MNCGAAIAPRAESAWSLSSTCCARLSAWKMYLLNCWEAGREMAQRAQVMRELPSESKHAPPRFHRPELDGFCSFLVVFADRITRFFVQARSGNSPLRSRAEVSYLG